MFCSFVCLLILLFVGVVALVNVVGGGDVVVVGDAVATHCLLRAVGGFVDLSLLFLLVGVVVAVVGVGVVVDCRC